MPAAPLQDWHDFFLVLGAAAGTLIGAMFVVVSIGRGFITRERAMIGHLFLTATIIHLASVLFACALVLVPTLSEKGFGTIFAGAGLAGLVYSGRNCFHIARGRNIVLEDKLCYGLVPIIAYLAMIAAAALALSPAPHATEILALALALLLIAGIRNAWDMIVFFVEKQGPGSES